MRTSRKWMVLFKQSADSSKKPHMRKEVGTWHYNKETVENFQQWCRQSGVKAFNSVRVTSTTQYARCLRATREVDPGGALVVAPHSATFNFLRVVHEMFTTQHTFPISLNWMNHDQRLPRLRGASYSELALAAWICRINSLEDSPFTPYMKWLLADTRGREGVSQGISRERGDEPNEVDQLFSELAIDACEDPEVWLEHIFRAFACLHLRAVPIETKAIEPLLDGTDFFKSKASTIWCPTLIPLVDAVPQLETGGHNVLVDYVSGPECADPDALARVCSGMGFSASELNPAQLQHGFFALRAMTQINPGDYLHLRGYPKLGVQNEEMEANMVEATRLMDNEYFD